MKRIHTLYAIARHAKLAAVTLATVVTLAGMVNAQAASPTHSHKKGMLNITISTEVGGTVLQPGRYEVREVNAADGRVLEFIHEFHNEQASELVQADEEEIVARVRFTTQPLSATPRHTELQLASNTNEATGLEVRGNPVAYSFSPTQFSAQR